MSMAELRGVTLSHPSSEAFDPNNTAASQQLLSPTQRLPQEAKP